MGYNGYISIKYHHFPFQSQFLSWSETLWRPSSATHSAFKTGLFLWLWVHQPFFNFIFIFIFYFLFFIFYFYRSTLFYTWTVCYTFLEKKKILFKIQREYLKSNSKFENKICKEMYLYFFFFLFSFDQNGEGQ
jgi:hypothetical protein